MMELDVTDFFNNACPRDYQASVAEIGHDAGHVTWAAAIKDSAEYPLLSTDEAREAFRDYAREFGAWSDDEIDGWSDTELNALCIQMAAAEIRDFHGLPGSEPWDWDEYARLSSAGTISGRLFPHGGRVYFEIGI